MTHETMMLLTIGLPLVAGLLVLLARKGASQLRELGVVAVTVANLALAICLFGKEALYSVSWGPKGIDFALRLYQLNSFVLLATAGFAFLVMLYSWKFMRDRQFPNQFYSYALISLAFTNGALLANNLILLLFFWEGLLIPLFGIIAIGGKDSWKTAVKAIVIVGITDVCMMLGILMTGWTAGTWTISEINLQVTALGSIAMVLFIIGAISKAGSMPFHSWIPDAAIDAPLPFMAFLPASLEKLLGIYLLARITLDMYTLNPSSWVSTMLMIVGSATILLAVMMALIQKDFKRLLSYHAISQVGYMVLGVGTALPIGIVGGLFHMINHAMYKSCLFLTGGAVEKQTGTTNLAKLGGIGRKMPITFICFIIAAAAISGVPPLNGFFSKELIYDGALERNVIFYIAALLGSFFTAASFLKLGHSAFLGKRNPEHDNVKEAPLSMLVPMIVIAGACVLFGVWNWLPLTQLIQPAVAKIPVGESYVGWPASSFLVILTVVVLLGALINHILGARLNAGGGLHAVDHIQFAPGLGGIYSRAEKRAFDPYDLGLKLAGWVAQVAWACDRAIDWIYNGLVVSVMHGLGKAVRLSHTGDYSLYVLWALGGAVLVLIFLFASM